MKERLDVLLVRQGFAESREKAKAIIMSGNVYVNDQKEDKAGAMFDESKIQLEVRGSTLKYVSRGGLKLEAALDAFRVLPEGKICVDIGASTGGFTEVWLEHGAAGVYAVDVGKDQLAPILRNDPRVVNLEKTDVRTLSPEAVGDAELCSIDVSFISLTKILASSALTELYSRGGKIIALVKPQFEAGKSALDKHGIVKKASDHIRVLDGIRIFANSLGYKVSGLIPSPIQGGDGNREYLIYLADSIADINTTETVKKAFSDPNKE